jgi:hypothetical protein
MESGLMGAFLLPIFGIPKFLQSIPANYIERIAEFEILVMAVPSSTTFSNHATMTRRSSRAQPFQQ